MKKPLKLLIDYSYTDHFLSCAFMLEMAFLRRDDVKVYRRGNIDPKKVDVVFNSPQATHLKTGERYSRGKLSVWWDIEACRGPNYDEFDCDLILAPYTLHDVYPKDKTYLMHFATDPTFWHHYPNETILHDVGFLGREDMDRTKRVEWLDFLQEYVDLSRSNGVTRGQEASQHQSRAKIILQIAGDALSGAMETRMFEMGLVGLIAADLNDANREDMTREFEPDVNFISFETKEEMVEKIWQVLEDEPLRLKMRSAAFKSILDRHTYDHRVQSFLETIGFVKGKGLKPLN